VWESEPWLGFPVSATLPLVMNAILASSQPSTISPPASSAGVFSEMILLGDAGAGYHVKIACFMGCAARGAVGNSLQDERQKIIEYERGKECSVNSKINLKVFTI
jgi:hypothetical protein